MMEIKISEEQLNNAINDNVEKAIRNALGSYSVEKAISDKITTEVANGVIADSLEKALANLDTNKLTTTLSEQIQKAMTGAVIHIIHEGLVGMLITMKKIPSYDDKAIKEEREKLYAVLKRS